MAVLQYLRKHWAIASFYGSLVLFGSIGCVLEHLGNLDAAQFMVVLMIVVPTVMFCIWWDQEKRKNNNDN